MKKQLLLLLVVILCFLTGIKAQVPYGLNSYTIGAPTVYLDFDGQTVISPYWGTYSRSGDTIVALPANISTEDMLIIYKHMVEDFKPFTINVTTDSTSYYAAPIYARNRVIFTQSSDWYGSAGGVAFIGSFRWGISDEVPCWVFTNLLSSNKRMAEAGSHEAGHTIGLDHQSLYLNPGTDSCKGVAEYDPGIGIAGTETSFAPIMGFSYSRNLTLWQNGYTYGCRTQDDLALIIRSNDFMIQNNSAINFRPDDYGGTKDLSTTINLLNNKATISGILEKTNDIDYFRIVLPTKGKLYIEANPTLIERTGLKTPNIDMGLTLENQIGDSKSYDIIDSVRVFVDTTLKAGIYYFKVNSVANKNIGTYGMIGSYNINVNFEGEVALDFQPTNNIVPRPRTAIDLVTVNGDSYTGNYFVNLPNTNNFKEIRVYSVTGTLLKSITNLEKVNRIYVGNYSPGMYIINVDGIKSFKIVRQ
jgi:hypothetical protein